MYLMTYTRPDLAYPLSILARYVAPGRHRPEHMAAAKRVLRYLCSTSGLGLVLGGRRPVVLTGHADASWADDQATQRSSQGYTFSLGSGSVSWRSTRSSSANTADIFTKALPPGDHQCFCTMLACFAFLDWSSRVCGQGHERYFLLVIDDYSRYTTVFPLRSKGDVTEVLIDWIRGARRQLSESFGLDLPVLRLHSDRGGEFSSDLLRAFCRAEGIRQTFTLPASPQQNGIAERRIGMVMDVARTSMIHAAAPHFLWPFAVQYAAHQINLQPRVSLPETTPTLRWMGKVGDASAFRVWGSQSFVRDTSADKLSSRAVPCVFLGFPPDAPGWQFYHPTLRRVLSSQDVTFDESVSYYRLFPYRAASLPPPPLFLASGTPPVDPLPP
ncbi:unnamed protein product [Closterium sp. NIES-53]